MLITKKVNLMMVGSMIKKFNDLGYKTHYHDIINIDISLLSRGSNIEVEFSCDICGKTRRIPYRRYLEQRKKYPVDTCSSKCSIFKTKQTNLEKYGYVSHLQNENIINKRKENNIKKYGFITNLMCEDTKNKIKITNLKKYGVENPSQSEIIQKRKEDTCMRNYGAKSPLQNKDIFEKKELSSHKLKNVEGYLCRGSYEEDFILKFKDRVEIEKPKSFRYTYKEKKKIYHPDFFIRKYNLVVEIKSDYTYNYDIEKNKAKKEACIKEGYNFIFIINKDYSELEKML